MGFEEARCRADTRSHLALSLLGKTGMNMDGPYPARSQSDAVGSDGRTFAVSGPRRRTGSVGPG